MRVRSIVVVLVVDCWYMVVLCLECSGVVKEVEVCERRRIGVFDMHLAWHNIRHSTHV
jgi:hypothetical protein